MAQLMPRKFTVLGLGSLMNEDWARPTCPQMENFRLVKMDGYRVVFNKTCSFAVLEYKLPIDDKPYASLSAVPDPDMKGMYVSAFEVPASEWADLALREFEYKLVMAPFLENGEQKHGVLCGGDWDSDEQCRQSISADPFRLARYEEFKRLYPGPLWRNDLLPFTPYLKRCLDSLSRLDQEVYNNWLETTFVGDGRTIKDYLKSDDCPPELCADF